jgi:DHA1 family tetracycline resistance protein-like MFS transporter
VLTLIDTRLILILGAAMSTWAAWRIGHWQKELAELDSRKMEAA